MLTINTDWLLIDPIHAALLDEETREGAETAARVIAMFLGFEAMVKIFERTQQRGLNGRRREAPFPDGRIATVHERVFGSCADYGFPSPGGAFFQGMHLSLVREYADDRNCYACRLDDGPEQKRSFGDLTAIGVYCDEPNQFTIVWIGRESDFHDAFEKIASRYPC